MYLNFGALDDHGKQIDPSNKLNFLKATMPPTLFIWTREESIP